MFEEQYCIVDCESYCPESKPNPQVDKLRYVGFKNNEGRSVIYHYTQRDEIQKALSYYSVIVGHNFKEYDAVLLAQHGFEIEWHTIIIDTMQVTNNRVKAMMYLDLNMAQTSLASLCKRFKLDSQKGEMDYSILEAESLEGAEYEEMAVYLQGDLDATEALYKYYYEFFYGFRAYMSAKDQTGFKWLTCTAGATAYKCICNMAGIPEEYEDVEGAQKAYDGGFVSKPYVDFVEGDIYCGDFNSLYPMMMIGGNLYSPQEGGWNGNDVYPSVYINDVDGIRGEYAQEQGRVEQTIKQLYQDRLDVTAELKAEPTNKTLKNKRLAVKILINTIYGIMGSPKFKSIYSLQGASDCTAMARRSIKFARTMLAKYGYECIITDTDSVYIKDPLKNFKQLESLTELISQRQIDSMNIPTPTHSFEIEAKIKRMYFFRDDNGDFIKKHYIYITDSDEVKVKGLKVIKGDCSKLAVKVFEDKIKPQFELGIYEHFTVAKMYELVKKEAEKHPELLTKRFRAKPLASYKNETSIQSQVAKRYGEGEHWLTQNKRIGVGKGVRYASLDELKKKYDNLWLDQVKFEVYLNDLKQFIDVDERKLIGKKEYK